jgi:hypothetical protein
VALLEDCREWCADIGLKRVPDHRTLCSAFHRLVKPASLSTCSMYPSRPSGNCKIGTKKGRRKDR